MALKYPERAITTMMKNSGVFTDEEINNYHDDKLKHSEMTPEQQEAITNIYEALDD
jgi:hypothetical protein